MSKLGKRLIGGLNEAIAIAGKNPAALQTLTIEVADVVEIQKSLKLTGTSLTERFRPSAATVRDWAHGRRNRTPAPTAIS